ncbi:Phospholipase/carboxylesterase [Rickenella mellea]|uniref:Acyl-protein thioesterase 1 n=1 Tax=Rickenella mellea TaxID=50990 RepID=A0A4R5XFT0_9AGAM|nr:Phospholipase/carboxylesterase [Rickenella mellea]
MSLLTLSKFFTSLGVIFGLAYFWFYPNPKQPMAALRSLRFLTVPPRTKHTATVIFVHGLGDTGAGWEPVAQMFGADNALSHVKWVLPHAPTMSVTANMGMEMPSWFDILSFGFNSEEDEPGMLKTMRSLNELVGAEVDAGMPASRIVLGGFSQGAAMSLLTGLTSERKLAGVVSLSGWLPLRAKFKSMASNCARSIPIFWGHGLDDPLVNFALGQASANFLKSEVGIPEASDGNPSGLKFKGYAGVPHSTSPQELEDVKGWLKTVLPKEEEEEEEEEEQ